MKPILFHVFRHGATHFVHYAITKAAPGQGGAYLLNHVFVGMEPEPYLFPLHRDGVPFVSDQVSELQDYAKELGRAY
jgi:hypothetical protein